MEAIEIVGASVTGAAHRAAGRNNQDAFAWAVRPQGLAAIVCDGCGSGAHSEVGSRLAAKLLAEIVASLMDQALGPHELLAIAQRRLLEQLAPLARALTGSSALDDVVTEYLLFTIVGVLVDGGVATTFSLGDGLCVQGGTRTTLGPFPGNAPPYLGHALLGHARSFTLHGSQRFDGPIVLGTDGADGVELGPLLADPHLFRNRDQLRRRLTVLGRSPGLLTDDTTLVVLRPRCAS